MSLLALAVRWPNHQEIPPFTDETEDLYRAFLAARGELFPLTDTSVYIGSLWEWLVAGAFWMSGFSLHAPRTLALLLGVATVAATFLLGAAWGRQLGSAQAGRWAGTLAALFLALSPGHVVVNSHVAWSNCITPLFTTLGVWLLHEAVTGPRRHLRRWIVLTGLAWGLALQTHPAVLGLLPGAAVFLLWRGRALLRERWPYIGAALFVAANLNLIAFNLMTGFGSVQYGTEIARSYAPGEELSPAVYAARLGLLALGLLQNLGGAVDVRTDVSAYLQDPRLWTVSLVALVAMLWHWQRGNVLPVLLLAGLAAILPLFNGKYEPVLNGRYLAPLLPVAFCAVASWLVVTVCEHLMPLRASWRRRLIVGAIGVMTATLLMMPLQSLVRYYGQTPEHFRSNARFFRTLDLIRQHRSTQAPVLIDVPLTNMVFGRGAGRIESAFRLALSLEDIPFEVVDLSDEEWLAPRQRCQEHLVVLGSRKPNVNDAIFDRLGLRAVDGNPAVVHRQSHLYSLYVMHSLSPQSATCELPSTAGR